MNTLEEFRKSINNVSERKMSHQEIIILMSDIEDFRDQYRYLPKDIEEWYDNMLDQFYLYNEALAGDWEG